MINRPLQVAEFLIENCQFHDVEEIFEISIEDKRIIEKDSHNCQEVSTKRFTPLNLDTDFHEQLKGSCLPNCNEELQYTEGRRYLKILIIFFHKKKYLSFRFLSSNVRILLMQNSRLSVKLC